MAKIIAKFRMIVKYIYAISDTVLLFIFKYNKIKRRWENNKITRLHREIIIENKKVTITTTQLDCKNSNQYSIIIIITEEQ